MVDYAEVTLLASSAFFAVLSIGLLFRYRQVSRSISESTDMGRDLWAALEQRLRKQDERILDMMARLDVVQSRVMSSIAPPSPLAGPPAVVSMPASVPVSVTSDKETGDVVVTEPVVPVAAQPESHREPPISSRAELDETQLSAVRLLGQKDMNTREITNALQRSREHTARIMKTLFEAGLVARDDSKKPFVYRLTEAGRERLN